MLSSSKPSLTGTAHGRLLTVSVQDDARERELLQLFNLHVPPSRSRAETDAFLTRGGEELAFELKSTTKDSVSTARDFGPDHIVKWKRRHWIFGFYDSDGRRLLHCHYASPADMAPWIKEKEHYSLPDVVLASSAAKLVDRSVLIEILGEKAVYTPQDAQWIMKRQWTVTEYREAQDVAGGYSPERMLAILQARCGYVIRRGATLNNPHIPASYFAGWKKITEDHAAQLRTLVDSYLSSSAAATDAAT